MITVGSLTLRIVIRFKIDTGTFNLIFVLEVDAEGVDVYVCNDFVLPALSDTIVS